MNEIYWSEGAYDGELELTNAYTLDGRQYYDHYVYYSYADINYEDIIKYGFVADEEQVSVNDHYIGCEGVGLIEASTGHIDRQKALSYLKQLQSNDSSIFMIYDAKQYLAQTLYVPGSAIISKTYTDEDGLTVAEVVHKGTLAYDEAAGN